MEMTGDAQATGPIGLTQDQAAQAFERLLAGDGDSAADETLEAKKPQASEDDEPEETLEASDDEELSEEPKEGDDEPEKQPKFRVKVEDEEFEVTQDELIRGYQREADYSRKTMALGEKTKAVESTLTTASQKRTEYETALGQIEAWFANTGLPDDDSDISHLRYSDPAEWSAQMQERQGIRQASQQRLVALKAERDRIADERNGEFRASMAERGKIEEESLLRALPDWSDPEKAKADQAMINRYASDIGIKPDELSQLMDHRLVVALRDAAKYRALQAKKPELQKRLEVKPMKSGAANRQAVSDLTRSKQRLAKTGRVDDAAAALMHILK